MLNLIYWILAGLLMGALSNYVGKFNPEAT